MTPPNHPVALDGPAARALHQALRMVLTAVNKAGTDVQVANSAMPLPRPRPVRTGGYSTAQGCEFKHFVPGVVLGGKQPSFVKQDEEQLGS